jgi:hypothetical protein
LFPALDSGEDAARIGGPDERFGIGIGFGDEAVDGGLEILDGAEHATLKPPTCEFGEEALDGIEPGGGSRGEVKSPTMMPGEPCTHLRMFVGGVIIDDGVDGFSLRHPRLDGLRNRMNS